jgi:EAL domain-containing protein (putative c-di-GMP-specific phosphodiesterase class I)/DNA-binding response OmpR family regulator
MGAASVAATARRRRGHRPELEALRQEPLRLLVIDDDEESFLLVRDLLGELESAWVVEWAPTYQTGLDGLAARRHDAAVLDYRLGAHSGIDLLGSAQAIAHRPPIVLLTGLGGRSVDVAAMAVGAAAYLDKTGLSAALLERTLRNAVERGREMAEQARLFAAIERDVARMREIQASLDLSTRERVFFARALARLHQRATPEETARDITDAITELPGIDFAAVVSFEASDRGRVLAVTAPSGCPIVAGSVIPAGRVAAMVDRAVHGAWAADWILGDDHDDYVTALRAMGLRAFVSAPVDGVEPVGLVVVGTTDDVAARTIDSQLPAAIEFAAAAASLIAGPLAARAAMRRSRGRIEATIESGAFDPVFQPIVDLATGIAVGFEALTRFRDGTRPDLLFAEAGELGIGLELEAATLERAIAASAGLPGTAWLGLNVSGSLIIERGRLARILERRTCPIVLEITEHDVITDYADLRSAIAALGPDIRIAVDDAGVGAANFSHIVELRPDFVKIDLSLVRGVDHDLTRQALVVGLRHFARAIDGWVIAEGVETAEERDALVGLDVLFGQGYLFGRPADVRSLG